MIHTLQFAADPVAWLVHDDAGATLSQAMSGSADPVEIPVLSPAAGTLIVAPRRCTGVAVLTRTANTGWAPSDVRVPIAQLYLPGHAGKAHGSSQVPGYRLAADTDVQGLAQRLGAALRDGSTVTVDVAEPPLHGPLILNGAALSHVAIFLPR